MRSDILRFLLLSLGVHVAALASWTAPSLPTYHALAALSVGLMQEAPPSAAAPAQAATEPVIKKSLAGDPIATTGPVKPRVDRVRRTKQRIVQNDADALVPKTPGRALMVAAVASRPWEPVWGSPPHSQAGDVPAPGTYASADARTGTEAQESASSGAMQTGRELRALIHGRLETDLSRYFYYPPIARKRGWEGNVRVRFTLDPDGRLTHVRIAQSSGYEVLDSSALEALSRVGNLREAAAWLNGQAVEVELPVIYRLQEP